VRRRRALLAGPSLALALARGAPPPAAGAQVPPLSEAPARTPGPDRTVVKTPMRDAVWLVDAGRRHWIADTAAFRGRGLRWEEVEIVSPAALRFLDVGPALHDGALLRDGASGDVYLVGDGRAQRVPDPLSFALYGLEWGRVRPAGGGELGATARGEPLPHAVTGKRLPGIPQTLAPPPSTRARAADDPRLAGALRLIEAYPPTAAWPAFLDRYGVTRRIAPVSGGLASYRANDRTLTVDPAFVASDQRAVATLLVHETLHALYDAGQRSGETGRACIDEEADAFAAQSAFWASQWGPDGRPDATTDLELELNRTLLAAEDDALVGRVISTFGYTLRCYIPEASGGPPPPGPGD
jgi:hypothetical protein